MIYQCKNYVLINDKWKTKTFCQLFNDENGVDLFTKWTLWQIKCLILFRKTRKRIRFQFLLWTFFHSGPSYFRRCVRRLQWWKSTPNQERSRTQTTKANTFRSEQRNFLFHFNSMLCKYLANYLLIAKIRAILLNICKHFCVHFWVERMDSITSSFNVDRLFFSQFSFVIYTLRSQFALLLVQQFSERWR